VRRTGLGRHSRLDDASGDPLDGLVNLFDLGLVLAVAFLIAGLGLAIDRQGRAVVPRAPGSERTVPAPPATGPRATGRGKRSAPCTGCPTGGSCSSIHCIVSIISSPN
jgi:hypothetical protein